MIRPDLVAIINIIILSLVIIANIVGSKSGKGVKPAEKVDMEVSEEERKVRSLLPPPTPQTDLKQGIAGLSSLFVLFWMAVVLLFAGNPILYYDSIRIRTNMHLIGLPSALLGIALYIWAKITPADPTISTITPRLRIKIINKTSGPYKYLRHPNFLGLLLTAIGTTFLIANTLYVLLIIPGMIITFVSQIEVNEKTLSGMFPEDYGKYRAKTPWKLIPYII